MGLAGGDVLTIQPLIDADRLRECFDAVISVTHGATKLLTRDELQGVIGHEFSHILNGDMRLNLRLMGILFGILCLAVIGRILLQTRGRSSRDRNPLPLFGLALLMIGAAGFLAGVKLFRWENNQKLGTRGLVWAAVAVGMWMVVGIGAEVLHLVRKF